MRDWLDDRGAMQTFERLVLKRVEFHTETHVAREMLGAMTVEQAADFFGQEIAIRLRAFMFAGETHETTKETIRRPLTWWDAFKLKFYPASWLDEWPARYETIKTVVLRQHVCPHLQIRAEPYRQELHVNYLAQHPGALR